MNQTENYDEVMCPTCGKSGKLTHVVNLPFFLFKKKAHILRCSYCGLGITMPPPEADIHYYQDNERNDNLFTGKQGLYESYANDLLNFVGQVVTAKGKTLLDVGCGGGFVVEAAQARGYVAEGIEANSKMVDWCRSRNLNVSKQDISQLLEAAQQYDVIVFSAVLEHLPDPLKILRDSMDLLEPNGVLVVSQASFDGLLPSVFPWGWYGWQPKEHFWHFTPNAMRELSSQAGFQQVSLIRNNIYHPWVWQGGVKNIVGRNAAAILDRIGNKIGMGDNFYQIFSRKR